MLLLLQFSSSLSICFFGEYARQSCKEYSQPTEKEQAAVIYTFLSHFPRKMPTISYSVLLSCEDLMVFFVLCDSTPKIFRFWTVGQTIKDTTVINVFTIF